MQFARKTAGFLLAIILTTGFSGCGAAGDVSAVDSGAIAAATSGGSIVTEGSLPAASSSATNVPSNGEYRPADKNGPAQNVPKPVEPEGMNVESEGGLFKFLSYWNQAVNYGVETGDFTAAKSLIGPGYSVDQ